MSKQKSRPDLGWVVMVQSTRKTWFPFWASAAETENKAIWRYNQYMTVFVEGEKPAS